MRGILMKKLFSGILAIALIATWAPASFATAVIASRANDANDLTAGAAFDNLGAWVLTVADNASFTTGNITTAGNGGAFAGTTTFAGTSTAQNIGVAGAALLAVNAGVAGETVTVSGDIYATTVNLTGTGSLALNGNLTGTLDYDNGATGTVTLAAAKTITGAVTNTTTQQGGLTLGSASSVTGAVGNIGDGLNTITVSGGNAAIGGNTAAVNFNLGANTLAITGTGILPATGTIATTATSGTTFGRITTTGNATVTAGTTVAVTVSGYVPNGTQMIIVNDATGAGNNVAGGLTVTSSTPNVTFAANSAAADDLTLTATRTTTAAATGNNTAVATTINGAGTPTGDFSTVLGQLDSLTSSSAIDAAYAQMDPVVNAGVNASSFNQVNLSIDALSQHLSETASGGSTPAPKSGVATGDEFKNGAIWAKGIGTHADQGTRSGIEGYTANLWGVTGGVDGEIADSLRLGLGGGYAATSVDNKGSDGGGTDLGSVQGTIYLNYDDPSPWYGTAGFSFNWNMYEGSRNIAFGTINRTAKSSYDGQQYTGFGEIGYVFKNMDIEQNQEWDITPLAGLTYSHLALDSYTETEAGDLNLNVSSQDYDLLQSSVGLKVERPWTTSDGKWVPEVHGKWLYDFIGDKAATTATFTGGGSSFSTNGADPAQSSFDMGAGLTFYSKGNISITGTYDFEIKSDYTSHTGQGVIRYTF